MPWFMGLAESSLAWPVSPNEYAAIQRMQMWRFYGDRARNALTLAPEPTMAELCERLAALGPKIEAARRKHGLDPRPNPR